MDRSVCSSGKGGRFIYPNSTRESRRPKGRRAPNGEIVRSRYGKYGHLVRESDPVSGVDYWQAGSVNARGQLTADTLGGVWATSWNYRDRSGQLLGVNHVGPAAQRQLDYRYDVFGNLRQQALNGGQSVEDYGYDAVGNFRWKTDFSLDAANAYGYDGGCGGGPNAVKTVQTAAGTRGYCYDANGNLISDSAGLAMAYDHANLPVKTSRGSATIHFAYGPDGMRTRQWGAGGTRIYVSGFEDLPDSGETKVYVGDYAVITKTATTRRVRYLLKDRLGSVDAVGDEAGNLVETRGYDAFGKPRSGDWHDLAPPRLQASHITPKGFTQHEHLDAVELIHMNGRAYDYQLGRFLGVDPFIQFPLNSQSLNPYSYILNNPLSGTDPTGYCSKVTIDKKAVACEFTPIGSRISHRVEGTVGEKGQVTFTGAFSQGGRLLSGSTLVSLTVQSNGALKSNQTDRSNGKVTSTDRVLTVSNRSNGATEYQTSEEHTKSWSRDEFGIMYDRGLTDDDRALLDWGASSSGRAEPVYPVEEAFLGYKALQGLGRAGRWVWGEIAAMRGAGAGVPAAGATKGVPLLDDLLRPGGKLLGSVARGATENIRTVSAAEFSGLQSQLMKLGGTQVQKATYRGAWYELPGGGGFGVRQAKSGPTLDFDLPGFPRGFKVHQQ